MSYTFKWLNITAKFLKRLFKQLKYRTECSLPKLVSYYRSYLLETFKIGKTQEETGSEWNEIIVPARINILKMMETNMKYIEFIL